MRRALLIAGVLVGVGGSLFAQVTRTPADGSAQDNLLAEVQALRAEINQVARAGLRIQLLIARLQLQEQRVITAARQLVDAQDALATVRTRITAEQARARQLDDAASRATDQQRVTLHQAAVEAAAHIEDQQRLEQEWHAREAELSRAVDDAQARWADFNGRLEAMERSVSTGASG